MTVKLHKDGQAIPQYIHRLVAQHFIPKVEGKTEVNHIDGDKSNNRVENLEWVTSSENKIHAIEKGLTGVGVRHPRAKLKKEDIEYIRENYIPYHKEFGKTALAKRFGVSPSAIYKIIKRQRHKY